jgi:hypothetical protein
MFNLGHNYMKSVTVKDGYRRVHETEIYGIKTVSFVEGERLSNL